MTKVDYFDRFLSDKNSQLAYYVNMFETLLTASGQRYRSFEKFWRLLSAEVTNSVRYIEDLYSVKKFIEAHKEKRWSNDGYLLKGMFLDIATRTKKLHFYDWTGLAPPFVTNRILVEFIACAHREILISPRNYAYFLKHLFFSYHKN